MLKLRNTKYTHAYAITAYISRLIYALQEQKSKKKHLFHVPQFEIPHQQIRHDSLHPEETAPVRICCFLVKSLSTHSDREISRRPEQRLRGMVDKRAQHGICFPTRVRKKGLPGNQPCAGNATVPLRFSVRRGNRSAFLRIGLHPSPPLIGEAARARLVSFQLTTGKE